MANLRSLIVKIGADTQNIEKALATVGESAKTLDAGLKKLGTTPVGRQAIADAEKLAASVKGLADQQQKLAERALLAARGLEAVGGPARLMRSELDQVAKTVQRGIDAFRALGQEAPAELRKVSAAIQQQQAVLKSSNLAGGVQGLLGGLGVSVGAGFGAAAGAGLAVALRQVAELSDALTKLSDRTGVSIVGLQRLDAIAKPSGNSMEQLADAINKFQKNLAEGDTAAGGALARIGLSFEQLRSQAPDEQFLSIARAIQSIKDPAEQTLVAVQLFGKGGAEILPSLKAKVDELADSTVKMSAASVEAWDALGDQIVRVKNSTIAAIGEIVGRFLRAQQEAPGIFGGLVGAGFRFGIETAEQAVVGPQGPSPVPPSRTAGDIRLPPGAPGIPDAATIAAIERGSKALADHAEWVLHGAEAYRRLQIALEQYAKIGTDSAILTRSFADQLEQFSTHTIDLAAEFDILTASVNRFTGGVTVAGDTLSHVTIPAFSTLPGQTPGNQGLIRQAGEDADLAAQIQRAQELRAVSQALATDLRLVGEVAGGTFGAMAIGLANLIPEFQAVIAAINSATTAMLTLNAALGVFGLVFSFGSIIARRFRGGATGGVVTESGIQHFAEGGRVLPFVGSNTDTVPAMLTPGEWILNKDQQQKLAGAMGGITVHNDNRGAFFGANAAETLASMTRSALMRQLAQNKDGDLTRLRGMVR